MSISFPRSFIFISSTLTAPKSWDMVFCWCWILVFRPFQLISKSNVKSQSHFLSLSSAKTLPPSIMNIYISSIRIKKKKFQHCSTNQPSDLREYIEKFPDWVVNEIHTETNTCWEATPRVMAARLTRLTHKIAIQLHLVAESCIFCSSRSRRPVRKLLDTPLYVWYSVSPYPLSLSDKRHLNLKLSS
jgi:hypothetical protein